MGNLHYTFLLFHSLLEYGFWFSSPISHIHLVYSKPTHNIVSQRDTDLHIHQIESLENPTPILDSMYMTTSDWQWTWVPDLSSRSACSWPFPPHYCYTLQTIASKYCTSCMCNAGGTVSVINDESHFIWELSACEKVESAPVGQSRAALKPMKIMRETLMPRPTYTRREESHNVYWWLLKWQTKCVYSSAKENVYWSLLII